MLLLTSHLTSLCSFPCLSMNIFKPTYRLALKICLANTSEALSTGPGYGKQSKIMSHYCYVQDGEEKSFWDERR